MRVGSKVVEARQAARHLFSAMRPGDQAALFSFDSRLDRVHGFTSDFSELDAALERVEPPYGQTSLYDAIAETARAAAAEASGGGRLPKRAAVVVLTDGIDTKSRLSAPEVSGIASAIDVPVYVMTIVSGVDTYRRPGGVSEEGDLSDLARWTGGQLFVTTSPSESSQAARQILSELRHQYLLAFEPGLEPGWHPVEVRVKDKRYVVRARSGYVAGRTRPVS
jgi:VWFA-related protein